MDELGHVLGASAGVRNAEQPSIEIAQQQDLRQVQLPAHHLQVGDLHRQDLGHLRLHGLGSARALLVVKDYPVLPSQLRSDIGGQ